MLELYIMRHILHFEQPSHRLPFSNKNYDMPSWVQYRIISHIYLPWFVDDSQLSILSTETSIMQTDGPSCKCTVYSKKYAHGFCFAVLCCGYTLTDFPISIRLTSLALWQSNDCPRASKATLKNMDKYFMWIHYERLHNHNKAKHNKTVCIFLGIYCKCILSDWSTTAWWVRIVHKQ